MRTEDNIKLEVPYNFDIEYLKLLDKLELLDKYIDFIYTSPYIDDYKTVVRGSSYFANELSRDEYEFHMNQMKKYAHGKMQLLLQNRNYIMPVDLLQYYINLGFTAFCCGSPQQAKLIKEYDSSLTTIASIVLHADKEKLISPDWDCFDYVVLDFKFGRDLERIKNLPKRKYMILANSFCNVACDGDRHWFLNSINDYVQCPGKYTANPKDFKDCILIRPMDLKFFNNYISVYKIQDRAWTTERLIRDIILYTTNFECYPGINYDEALYENNE